MVLRPYRDGNEHELVSHQMRQSVCVAVAVCVALSGCAGKKRVQKPTAARLGSTETGLASWYGHPYHGRRAANGEIYDMEKMTAAHRTLPLGTRLLVTNLRNGRTVEVRVNDRGPVAAGRIIDLSYAAAEELGAVSDGLFPVRVRVVSPSTR